MKKFLFLLFITVPLFGMGQGKGPEKLFLDDLQKRKTGIERTLKGIQLLEKKNKKAWSVLGEYSSSYYGKREKIIRLLRSTEEGGNLICPITMGSFEEQYEYCPPEAGTSFGDDPYRRCENKVRDKSISEVLEDHLKCVQSYKRHYSEKLNQVK